jgi:hypothetical protein
MAGQLNSAGQQPLVVEIGCFATKNQHPFASMWRPGNL